MKKINKCIENRKEKNNANKIAGIFLSSTLNLGIAIALSFTLLLIFSTFALADLWKPSKPSHGTLYADTITSKTDGSPVNIADAEGLYVTGNVGIGTTGQTEKLQVNGNIKLGDDSIPSPFWLSLTSAGASQYSGIRYGTNAIPDLKWSIYGFTSDANLHIKMGSTERVTIDSSGNVGIGTTGPAATLEVSNTGGVQARLTGTAGNVALQLSAAGGTYGDIYMVTSDAADNDILRIGGGGDVATNRGAVIQLQGNEASGAGDVIIRAGDAAESVIALMNGNVGIGTTSPGAKLDVNGDIISRVPSGPGAGIIQLQTGHTGNAGGYLDIMTDGSTRVHLNAYGDTYFNPNFGNFGIGTTNPLDKLSVVGSIGVGGAGFDTPGGTSGQGIAFPSTSNDAQRIYGEHDGGDTSKLIIEQRDNTNDAVIFRQVDCCGAGTLDYMRIARDGVWYVGSGNVGIGTTNPSAKLHVNGNIANNGIVTFANGDATPDVSGGNVFLTSNTGATIITDFDGEVAGQVIIIICGDAVTTISRAQSLLLNSQNFICATNSVINLVKGTIYWHEVSRSTPNG